MVSSLVMPHSARRSGHRSDLPLVGFRRVGRSGQTTRRTAGCFYRFDPRAAVVRDREDDGSGGPDADVGGRLKHARRLHGEERWDRGVRRVRRRRRGRAARRPRTSSCSPSPRRSWVAASSPSRPCAAPTRPGSAPATSIVRWPSASGCGRPSSSTVSSRGRAAGRRSCAPRRSACRRSAAPSRRRPTRPIGDSGWLLVTEAYGLIASGRYEEASGVLEMRSPHRCRSSGDRPLGVRDDDVGTSTRQGRTPGRGPHPSRRGDARHRRPRHHTAGDEHALLQRHRHLPRGTRVGPGQGVDPRTRRLARRAPAPEWCVSGQLPDLPVPPLVPRRRLAAGAARVGRCLR